MTTPPDDDVRIPEPIAPINVDQLTERLRGISDELNEVFLAVESRDTQVFTEVGVAAIVERIMAAREIVTNTIIKVQIADGGCFGNRAWIRREGET